MAKIRDLFHEVGNFHNKISVCAGLAKMELAHDFKGKSLPPETKKLLSRLSDLEKNAIEASVILNQLKDAVYNIADPDIDRKCDGKEGK
jgi:hypothetical protein